MAVVQQGTRLDIVSVEQKRDARPRVTRCESYPLDGDLVSTLTRLRQGGKLEGRCATLLSAGEYQFLAVEAPPLPESAPQAELREAVRWKVKDMVEFPVTAAGVDVLRIPPQPGRPAQLLVVAASHGVLKPLAESFDKAKTHLDAITVPELAQRNLACLFETQDRALALLSFSAQGGLLTLTCNGELYSTRRIEVSAAELAGDASLYERVVLDIQRSLDNFDRNFSHLSLQRLLVVPVPAADDFIAHLKDNLYQPVETLAISDGLDISAAPMLANAATLADALPALGLALGLGLAHDAENIGVNLYDPALLPQREVWTSRNLGMGLAASLLLCGTWGAWAHWQQAQVDAELKAVEPQVKAARDETLALGKQITGYKPDARLQAALDDGHIRLESRGEVLALLRRGMSPTSGNPGELLRGFARQIPAGLWLTGFSVNANSGALEIHGRTTDPRLIPEYIRRLNAEPSFQGRTFAALEISTPDQKPATASTATSSTAAVAQTAQPAQPTQSASAAAPTPGASGPARFHEFALTSAQGSLSASPATGGPL
jgi:MSHA biogenesis protein MshI